MFVERTMTSKISLKNTGPERTVNLVFPHQLFAKSPLLENGNEIYLVEEYLFFRHYAFHKQKLAFQRATMRFYMNHLQGKGIKVNYIDSSSELSDVRILIKKLKEAGVNEIHVIDPTDDWLEQRIRKSEMTLNLYESQLFLNTRKDNEAFFRPEKTSFFQTTFYKQQRKKRKVLLDEDGNPLGGKWTYDTENRKKYPKGKTPPAIHFPESSPLWEEAVQYVEKHFSKNPGELSKNTLYPIDFKSAQAWFQQFLEYRFYDFGVYEDAIVRNETFLHHSVFSPLLNVGLLMPEDVLKKTLAFAEKENIPINSTEGFVRQIMGWREFIRGIYESKGSRSRTLNFWEFDKKIPESFYTATTGIDPVDQTIRKVLKTGYCHHIERLMILGNFMLLCEFDPNEVYRWFMELFIDAYDWVMVPNVYGMSQFSDGGLFATKPYIGGSNYIRKMSDYGGGDWEAVWDGLFWRFIHKHRDFFKDNPRLSMMYHTYNRMSEEKQTKHLENAELFLKKLECKD